MRAENRLVILDHDNGDTGNFRDPLHHLTNVRIAIGGKGCLRRLCRLGEKSKRIEQDGDERNNDQVFDIQQIRVLSRAG
jgi:hypothetical protein